MERALCDHSPVSLRGRKKKAPGHRGWRRNRKTKQESTLHVHFLGAGYSRRAQFTSVKLGRETPSGAAGRRAWGAARKVRAPRLAGKARSGLILPAWTDPGGPVGPPAQAPPPKPRPSFWYRPQRQQGTPNTNLSPASKESTQPLLLKKKKKNVPSVRTQQEPCLTASSPARLTFLIWRIRQAHTEARRSRPARRLGRGVGRQAALRTVLGRQPISPKNRNPRRHREVAESPEVDEPLPHVDASGPGGGGHPVHPHTLAPRVPPHPGSHLCSGGREKDPPAHRPAPSPPIASSGAGHGVPGGGPGEPWLSWGQPILGPADPGATPGKVGEWGASRGRRGVKGYARGYPAPTQFPPTAFPGVPTSPGVTDGQWHGGREERQADSSRGLIPAHCPSSRSSPRVKM